MTGVKLNNNEAEKFFRGIRFIERWKIPQWAAPYVLGLYLGRWPRKVK